jgi:SEC-C motif domain protein
MLLNPFCPCGSQNHYADCCQRYLDGRSIAPTAEALMRSRYSAYSKQNLDYLIQTQHPKTRKKDDAKTIRQTFETTHWTSLTIVKTQKGTATDKRGTVEFIATHQDKTNPLNPNPQQLHERSRFIQEDGQWYYLDGDILPPIKKR